MIFASEESRKTIDEIYTALAPIQILVASSKSGTQTRTHRHLILEGRTAIIDHLLRADVAKITLEQYTIGFLYDSFCSRPYGGFSL